MWWTTWWPMKWQKNRKKKRRRIKKKASLVSTGAASVSQLSKNEFKSLSAAFVNPACSYQTFISYTSFNTRLLRRALRWHKKPYVQNHTASLNHNDLLKLDSTSHTLTLHPSSCGRGSRQPLTLSTKVSSRSRTATDQTCKVLHFLVQKAQKPKIFEAQGEKKGLPQIYSSPINLSYLHKLTHSSCISLLPPFLKNSHQLWTLLDLHNASVLPGSSRQSCRVLVNSGKPGIDRSISHFSLPLPWYRSALLLFLQVLLSAARPVSGLQRKPASHQLEVEGREAAEALSEGICLLLKIIPSSNCVRLKRRNNSSITSSSFHLLSQW